MEFIKGYKYANEEDAINAVNLCNAYYGIPTGEPEEVTENWCGYYLAEYNDPKFWYIVFDESLLPILGEPIEFEVNILFEG
jgi:hypothetical protein